jgi:type I restriction enzyme M protein
VTTRSLQSHSEKVNFLWSIAELLRDAFKRGKYQDVILPLTVLRRIDQVLTPTKQRVLERNAELAGKGLENRDGPLRAASGFAFWNTSQYDLDRLFQDAPSLRRNLENYVGGFSENMRDVLERFDFGNTIKKLDEAGLLFLVLERFKNVDLHPERVSNHEMGTIFEELIRRFNEALNENPGEHFTPRDVVDLMVDLLLAGDEGELAEAGIVRTVYDPCCGSGGMLTIAKERVLETNPRADIHLFGQEVNPETWAIARSDLLLTSPTGRDADHIAYGSVLSRDGHAERRFDYLITNPPYGKEWRMDEDSVRAEHSRGAAGRFGAGLPRISDGQLLFLQHLVARMKPAAEGGSRIAIIMNGSPLFTGDAGSGESEIRRFLLESDLVEAIVQLPEQLFYNTGITTYVWLLTNRKAERRRGLVQLVDASSLWTPMRRSLGDKRREITPEQIREIVELHDSFEDSTRSRIFPTTAFGYRKITVERPLRLRFEVDDERIARLDEQRAFARADEELRESLRSLLGNLAPTTYSDRADFLTALAAAADDAGVRLAAPMRRAIVAALGERDEEAAICIDAVGNAEPDPELRDHESVPLDEDVDDFFAREVAPHVPDAWIDRNMRDAKDGEVGKVGYEINVNRVFYEYVPPRPLEEIEADIREVEQDILAMLGKVAGPAEALKDN